MKKIIFMMTILPLCQLNLNTMAVNSVNSVNLVVIEKTEAINPYDQIWEAICKTESNSNVQAYNHKEQATGIVQIRPIRLLDYNQRTNSNYKLVDCYKAEVSKKIFMYYANKFHSNQYDKIATDWNKCKSDRYWNKVKKHLKHKNNNAYA